MQIRSEMVDTEVLQITLEGRMDVTGTLAVDPRFTALAATRHDGVVDRAGECSQRHAGRRTAVCAFDRPIQA